jgi:hypothetical protein
VKSHLNNIDMIVHNKATHMSNVTKVETMSATSLTGSHHHGVTNMLTSITKTVMKSNQDTTSGITQGMTIEQEGNRIVTQVMTMMMIYMNLDKGYTNLVKIDHNIVNVLRVKEVSANTANATMIMLDAGDLLIATMQETKLGMEDLLIAIMREMKMCDPIEGT